MMEESIKSEGPTTKKKKASEDTDKKPTVDTG